ncbi:MAG: pentapeptide repeat-containing protein [Xenococcus sp. (in: cyanobacteria)]
MKAAEVLRRYAAGERNFQRVNLRGQSFKGADLSGADFSESDIRSTNFKNANLQGVNFTGAKAGLQKRWVAFLLFISFLLSGLSGFLSNFAGYLISLLFYNIVTENFYIELFSLIILVISLIITLSKGIIAGALAGVFTIVGVFAFPEAFTIAGVFAGAFTIAGVFAFAVAIAEVGAFSGAVVEAETIGFARNNFAGAFALSGSSAGSIAGIGALAKALTEAGAEVHTETGSVTGVVVAVIASTGALAVTSLGLLISRRALEGDERDALLRSSAVAFAATGGTNFKSSNLTDAIFTRATLKNTDFRKAVLTRTNFRNANKLDLAFPGGTYLKNLKLQQWLTGTGQDKNFDYLDLRGVNFQGKLLTDASFIGADLSEANLQDSDLYRAKLFQTQLYGVNLTGACIEDWIINVETNLNNVICDFIYLKKEQSNYNTQEYVFSERRPADPKRKFKPGEFTKLYQKTFETIDLLFREGVDWKAVAYSLRNTQVLNQDTPLAIQSIENKGDGFVLIKVNVPENTDKGKIEGDFWQGYEFAQNALKEQYETRLLDKDKFINKLFDLVHQSQEKLGEVPKLMAEQPKIQQNFNAPVNAVAGNVEGNQNIYAPEQKTTLAEAAEEIQKLLKQLEQTNPTATIEQQQAYVNAAIPRSLKDKCVDALVAGGETAMDELFDNPFVQVGKAIVKCWISE